MPATRKTCKRPDEQRGSNKLKLLDCNEKGLIFADGTVFPSHEIEVIGKTEYPLVETTRVVYYLRRKAKSRNVELFENWGEHERHLKMKVLDLAKQQPHIRFVVRSTLFSSERNWNLESESKFDQYLDSPAAEKARREYKQQAPIIFSIFLALTIGLFLILWVTSFVRK